MKLKEKIEEKGLTANELARLVKVDAPTISKFKNYKVLPIPATMESICNVLDCEVEDIYEPSEINFKKCKKSVRTEFDNYKVTVRLPREAKAKIRKALKICGYRNVSYWINRCYERLLAQCEIIEKAQRKKASCQSKTPNVKSYRLVEKDNANIITEKN